MSRKLDIREAVMDKQDTPARPRFGDDGTVHVPAFELPPSEFSSPEARAAMAARAGRPAVAPPADLDIAVVRSSLEAMLAPQVARMREVYPVDVAEQTIGGVTTHVITPQGRPHDPERVLINLHGGAFAMCADACALLESIPVAALGGYKVITVDYRMAPEALHPAAVEDLEIVYRELLKRYEARRIGIYGCSAGGSLAAQAAAWLPAHGLPQPGAIGIFGSGAVRFSGGDSAHVTAYIDGSFPAPPKPGERGRDLTYGYFAGSDMGDPFIAPALHLDVLAKFPPTLIITGTRATDMSPAVYTNSQLLKAGVRSTLIVGEAMGHCYIYQADLPEARDTHQAIVNFFRETLQ
jgi:monoterpene epsilon-lactone hydrolase